MIPDCVGQTDRRSDGRTESIIAKTALCIASYANELSIIPFAERYSAVAIEAKT